MQLQAAGKPLDRVWEDCCNHPDVAHLLQPLPQPAAPKTDPNLRVHPYGSGKGTGKDGKSKGKGLNSLPAALREHGYGSHITRSCLMFWLLFEELQISGEERQMSEGPSPMLLQRMFQESSLP